MTFIIHLLLLLCMFAVDAMHVLAWFFFGWQIGVAGLIATIAFILAYGLSVDAALSPRDFWSNSEWDIFCKKMSWAWGVAAIIYAISYIVIAYFYGDVIGVMPEEFRLNK